ncbi:NHL repeat-containing protein [Pyxidicoccus parkwayensis]|uniref:NHL repeat-containing protein n=1 Tax=Pyxidicoccus parkwayensis TaxID=2813578 RepID=A0ABX7PAD6_9BACT|nr:NHL repeat-containing protein [Pyxidicoccus parkwaysis]QSQ27396.1 NHL repeat-containing protein [Pyxidicoccus parkwaysis]
MNTTFPGMTLHLERRHFLRLSAVGAASFILPVAGTGCAGSPGATALQVGGRDALVYFDTEGQVLELRPREHRVVVRGADGAEVATLGGFGRGATELNGPAALALGTQGRVYVADRGNHRVQVYTRDGAHVGQVGRAGKEAGQFLHPTGLGVDAQGRLLVADSLNHRVQVFSAEGTWLGTFGAGELQLPRGIAVGPDGHIHVVDSGNARVVVYDAAFQGVGSYGHFGREGSGMMWPRTVVVDSAGTAYVADSTCNAVHVFDAAGDFVERIPLQRESRPAAAVHLALSPTGELKVAARAGRPE